MNTYNLLRTTPQGQQVFHVVNDAFWVEPCNGGFRQCFVPDAAVFATAQAACEAQAGKVQRYLQNQTDVIGYCHYCGQSIANCKNAVPAPLGGFACRECQ